MKWLDAKIDEEVRKQVALQVAEVKGILAHLDQKLSELRIRIDEVKARLDSMDKTVASMTYDDLDKYLQNRLIVFEGNVDDKIVGLYRSVDSKISNGNGNVKATAGFMKRIAHLEGIKDATEHRRSSKELLDRIDHYSRKLLELDRNDDEHGRFTDAVNILKWVLGEQNG